MKTTSNITVELTGVYGDDLRICRQAWVSSLAEQAKEKEVSLEKQQKLINVLMKQKHGSPFEAGYLEYWIYAPRGVRDEHVRHRVGWSYSSASSRYREIAPVFYIPGPDRPLKKVEGFKKMLPQYEPLSENEYEKYVHHMETHYGFTEIEQNFIKEIVDSTEAIRWLNPDGQMIPYIARCNPRSLMHFLSLRTHDSSANHPSYPMYEIEQVAKQMEYHFASHFPLTHQAFQEAGREAP